MKKTLKLQETVERSQKVRESVRLRFYFVSGSASSKEAAYNYHYTHQRLGDATSTKMMSYVPADITLTGYVAVINSFTADSIKALHFVVLV